MTAVLVDAIRDSLPHVKSGSVVIFGGIFGSRIDNMHEVVGATLNDGGSTTIHFNEGETLTLWGADGIVVGDRVFTVATATRVRWEWFYYGRPQVPENRYFQDYRAENLGVVARTNADWDNSPLTPRLGQPAVEIL